MSDCYKTGDVTISNGCIRIYVNEPHTKGYFVNDQFASGISYLDRRTSPEYMRKTSIETVVCTLTDVFKALETMYGKEIRS